MLHNLQAITQSASVAAAHAAQHTTVLATRLTTGPAPETASGSGVRRDPDIGITPNTDGLPGIDQLKEIAGALMSIGLILAVVALIVAAIVWAFGANSSNPHLAGRGKTGILVAAVAGVVCGAAVALVNFGWDLGQEL